jgi:hypothetical protein
MMAMPMVHFDEGGKVVAVCARRVGTPLVYSDPVSGRAVPDVSLGIDRCHGLGLADVGSQTPVRMRIAGDHFTHDVPPEANTGCRGTVYRQQRFPAIRRIHPESTVTIGTISRQSYQYVAPLTPDTRPFNAFGNPPSPSGRPNNVIQIDYHVVPALEPPRWNYTGLSTETLQKEHDTVIAKVQMRMRGVR